MSGSDFPWRSVCFPWRSFGCRGRAVSVPAWPAAFPPRSRTLWRLVDDAKTRRPRPACDFPTPPYGRWDSTKAGGGRGEFFRSEMDRSCPLVSLTHATAHLSGPLDKVENGEEVVIICFGRGGGLPQFRRAPEASGDKCGGRSRCVSGRVVALAAAERRLAVEDRETIAFASEAKRAGAAYNPWIASACSKPR